MYTRFLREANPTDGGGGLQGLVDGLEGLTPLPDLDNPPQPATPDPAQAAKDAEQATLKTEAFEADGTTLKPGYVKAADGTLSKDPNYVEPVPAQVEGVDEQGNLLPGFKKDEQGNVIADPDYVEPELSDEEQSAAFFERVHAITGDAIEIEYPEGVHPLSPEGIAHYTQVIRDDAVLMFEEHLREKDPVAYAYMLHRAAGKPDEEFHTNKSGFVLPAKEDFDKSADMQAAVFKYDLKVKGLDDETIEVLVKKAIADNKLKEKADAAYTLIDTSQKQQLEDIAKENEQRNALANRNINAFVGKVDKNINSELKFIVPEADKPAFRKFVLDNLEYNDVTQSFSLKQEISEEKLVTMLEAMFFQFKNGNLSALVTKQAKTIAAQSLRLKLQSNTAIPGSGKGGVKADDNFVPLSSITVNSGN